MGWRDGRRLSRRGRIAADVAESGEVDCAPRGQASTERLGTPGPMWVLKRSSRFSRRAGRHRHHPFRRSPRIRGQECLVHRRGGERRDIWSHPAGVVGHGFDLQSPVHRRHPGRPPRLIALSRGVDPRLGEGGLRPPWAGRDSDPQPFPPTADGSRVAGTPGPPFTQRVGQRRQRPPGWGPRREGRDTADLTSRPWWPPRRSPRGHHRAGLDGP